MFARTGRAAAQFAVAIHAPRPDAGDAIDECGLTLRQRRAQVVAVACEQTGIQLAVGRHPRAVAVAAERLADRTDESDLAAAVGIGVARRDFATIVGVEWAQRPLRVD